jgi:geranylgeranyl pyrophosphate synthase
VTSPATTIEWATTRRAELDRLFEARLAPPPDGDPGRLLEAMRYSLLAPGKRIRPLLALAAAETVGPVDGDVLLACAAVELVHCYSLIHDDLPPMDDDDFRRGRPSNHKAFGEATAILAGDALLTLAFDWIAEAGERADRPQHFLAASRALAHAAGRVGHGARPGPRPGRAAARDAGGAGDVARRKDRGAVPRRAARSAVASPAATPMRSRPWRASAPRTASRSSTPTTSPTPSTASTRRARGALESLIADACAAVAPLGPRAARLDELARALATTCVSPLSSAVVVISSMHAGGRANTLVRGAKGARGGKRDRAYLVVLAGASVGEMYKVEGDKVIIGRGQKAHIRLFDDGISREHAQIVIEGNQIILQDLGSTNGTFCNGLKVDRRELVDGDKILVGSTTILKFTYHDNLTRCSSARCTNRRCATG